MKKLLHIVIFLFIYGTISVPLHEAGHSLAAQIFRAPGRIEIDWFTVSGAFYTNGDLETWEASLVFFAGGGFVALIYALMLWFANLAGKWGEVDKTPIRLILGAQLGYGAAEISALFQPYDIVVTLGTAGIVIGAGIALFYSLPKLFHGRLGKYLKEEV